MSYERLMSLSQLIDVHREHTPEALRHEYDDILLEMADDIDLIALESDLNFEDEYMNVTNDQLDLL